jgi:hypothetical protein
MKKIAALLSTLLVIHLANAQGCLPSGITFSTQQQIDNFQASYPGCTKIEGSATISGADIVNLSGLNILTAVEGTFSISYNSVLTNLIGLEMLNEVGNSFIIGNNGDLENLSALESITSIGYDFKIGNNPNLSSIVTSGQLQQVYGSLEIHNNEKLSSLSGFESLTTVGAMSIISNSTLSSLEGLENIDGNSMVSLEISYNPNLSICDVQSVCDFLETHYETATIMENAPGCEDKEVVQQACGVFIDNFIHDTEYSLFPNPANQSVTITTKNGSTINEVSIYNPYGQKVYHGIPDNNTLDISKLQPGIYVVEVLTEEGNVRKKLIVQ